MQDRRPVWRRQGVLIEIVDATTMDRPQVSLDTLRLLVFIRFFKAIIKPGKMQGSADPGYPGDQMQPSDDDAKPIDKYDSKTTPLLSC